MKILWICDAWRKINQPSESTLRLIEESCLLGHENWFCDADSIFIERKKLFLVVSPLHFNGLSISKQTREVLLSLEPFDKVFFRCDPPFTTSYNIKLKLLIHGNMLVDRNDFIINSPEILLKFNSKISIDAFVGDISPLSLISSNRAMLENFCTTTGKVVAKTLTGGDGVGIELITWNEVSEKQKAKQLLSLMTHDYTKHIQLQEYLDIFTHGEIRIWFVKGEVICVAKKQLKGSSFKFSMEKGDRLSKHELTEAEIKTAAAISSFLQKQQIHIAAVDMIDSLVIDFNISSPGLLKEMENTLSENIAAKILNSLLHPLTN